MSLEEEITPQPRSINVLSPFGARQAVHGFNQSKCEWGIRSADGSFAKSCLVRLLTSFDLADLEDPACDILRPKHSDGFWSFLELRGGVPMQAVAPKSLLNWVDLSSRVNHLWPVYGRHWRVCSQTRQPT